MLQPFSLPIPRPDCRHLEQSDCCYALSGMFAGAGRVSNASLATSGSERRELVNQNIMLRREADTAGDVQVATLLGGLEPILLDIANLRDKPRNDEVRTIKDRVERQSLVALLQVNSVAVARANE